jgi:hypothetical protein
LVTKKRGEILKAAGEVDFHSRYICEGFVGNYRLTDKDKILFAIFQASDTAFDFDSYRSGIPNPNELKTISPVKYLEFSVANENEIISECPHLMRLALLINQRIIKRQMRIQELSKMKMNEAYPLLLKEYRGIGSWLTNEDLSAFFQVSLRTINRNKRKSG